MERRYVGLPNEMNTFSCNFYSDIAQFEVVVTGSCFGVERVGW
jgi:hypothetical protein